MRKLYVFVDNPWLGFALLHLAMQQRSTSTYGVSFYGLLATRGEI